MLAVDVNVIYLDLIRKQRQQGCAIPGDLAVARDPQSVTDRSEIRNNKTKYSFALGRRGRLGGVELGR